VGATVGVATGVDVSGIVVVWVLDGLVGATAVELQLLSRRATAMTCIRGKSLLERNILYALAAAGALRLRSPGLDSLRLDQRSLRSPE